MSQTISEKILAKYSGRDTVKPGEYVVIKDFVGPIVYSYGDFDYCGWIYDQVAAAGAKGFARPENCILNGDHNTPPQSISDIELFKAARRTREKTGVKLYDRGEGIGHIVNVEKGDILPGKAFVHFDPQASCAGGIGAFFTNGGRYGSTIFEGYACGEMTLRVPETIKVEINGVLGENLTSRDVWFRVLGDLGPDCALGMVIEFAGTCIDRMPVEQRMVLCGSVTYSGADGGIIKSDRKTRQWFQEELGLDAEMIESDGDAVYERVYTYNAEDFVPMVTYPPEIYTTGPAREFSRIKVDQCVAGTCAGGTLDDLRIMAGILKGRRIHPDVRFIVSPVTRRVYLAAAREGLIADLVEAGAVVLPPTCDVCLGVKAPVADGEVSLSQQTMNTPGRSGSQNGEIYLAGAATIAASAITGYITDPREVKR
jgi:3-isopropylmalate/(R)-2-methylmalate dehydratase large subunit